MSVDWVQFGPIIAAVVSGVCTIIAAAISKSGTPSKQIILSIVSVVALASLLVLVLTGWNPRDKWSIWQEEIKNYLAPCSDSDSARCLVNALEKFKPPFNTSNQGGRFYEDMRAGEILLQLPKAHNTLTKAFGIHGETFTGSGYSGHGI